VWAIAAEKTYLLQSGLCGGQENNVTVGKAQQFCVSIYWFLSKLQWTSRLASCVH